MIIRKTASILLATLIVSASFVTAADAATSRRHMTHHSRAAMRHSTRGAPAAASSGSAATDALNQQSLSSARGGATQMPTQMPAQTPAQ